jgi:hypothetical protein
MDPITLDKPDCQEHARAICDEVWGATGLAARLPYCDRVHVELFVEDMLRDFCYEMEDDAEEKAEERGGELADELKRDADDDAVDELAAIRANGVAADILETVLANLPRRSRLRPLVAEQIAKLRKLAEAEGQ